MKREDHDGRHQQSSQGVKEQHLLQEAANLTVLNRRVSNATSFFRLLYFSETQRQIPILKFS